MKFWILTFWLVASLGLSGCPSGATPPMGGPNNTDNEPPPNSEPLPDQGHGGLYSDTESIKIPNIPVHSPGDGEPSPSPDQGTPKPNAIISSAEGLFDPGELILVGVELPDNFNGIPPLVGPIELKPSMVPATLALVQAQEDGSVYFGIYTDFDTTPGTYYFFATEGNLELSIELPIVASQP